MCGILALIDTPWQPSISHALNALKNRGPDAQTQWQQDTAILAHARLSVIDPQLGSQPILSEDRRYVLIFNGEIYNFKELREELEKKGHRFTTHSDTEIILRGFMQWGHDVVPRFNGMFAFAIWDTKERKLFAARDRLGIKPLFYSTVQGLSLASTLASFFQLENFPRTLDYEALRDYLAFQVCIAPHSFLKHVKQLPPAHTFEWQPGKDAVIKSFWQIPSPVLQQASSVEDIQVELDHLLQQAVKRQLIADVPIGAFLSGGIDSSLIVHYMANARQQIPTTFSVRFAGKEFDETDAALAVSRKYGTDHHIIDAPDIGPDELLAAINSLDQPLADPAFIPTYELAKKTRDHVTVALSGDGGDELFGGYEKFLDTEIHYPNNAIKKLLRGFIDKGLAPGSLLRRSLAEKEMLLYRRIELGPWSTSRKNLSDYLSPEIQKESQVNATLHRWRELASSFGDKIDTAGLMRADLWTYLSENCLAKTDRASMAHSLEVRVPLLDNTIADFALNQSGDIHVKPELKALLRSLAKKHLPDDVWARPKHGFSVPLLSYFNGPWRDICENAIARTKDLAPFLKSESVHKLWQNARAGKGSRRLAYTFIVLLLWLEQNSLS